MKRLIFVLMFGLGVSGSVFSSEKPVINNENDNCIATTDIQILPGSIDYQKKLQVLKGKLYNSSTLVEYEKVQLRVNYFDHTRASLGNEIIYVSRDVKEGETDMFMEHLKAPKNTHNLTVDVVCAEEKGM